MKKAIIIFCISLFTIPCFSYTWIPFCPDSIHAENICFGVGSWKGTICSPEGMYLWEDDIMEWSFYTYGLPVTGAASLDDERILVVMGNGSWSDGVYTFNLQTHQFEVVEWMINPNFLLHNYTSGKYYIGCQFGGLWESADGLTWTSIPYFDGKSCTAMDYYANNIVVSEVSNVHNIYISNDSGTSWMEASSGSPMISDLKFNFDGDLYGIFPGYSNSSGLWSSDDYGNTWEVEFWSDNMSAMGFDAMSTAFVGWESPTSSNEGIAMYTPNSGSPNLSPLNEGLPNLHINKILMNISMSAIAIFCCTDAGVYSCYDYMVGVEDLNEVEANIKLFPNPVSNQSKIKINLAEIVDEKISIIVLNNQGQKVDKIEVDGSTSNELDLVWNKGNLRSGVYYLVIKTDKERTSKKFIIL